MAGALAVDGFSLFITITICVGVILGALMAEGYLPREDLEGPEFYVLLMLVGLRRHGHGARPTT